jgi:tetratricopeptide (TPR) repeat protein
MYSVLSRIFNLFNRMIFQLALALALFSLSLNVIAEPQEITEDEMQLIPRYCPDTMTFSPNWDSSPKSKYWLSVMGNGFKSMHHYCWARITMNRAAKAGLQPYIRQGMWESALADYKYVIKFVPPTFILLPEIYTRVGEVEILLRRPDKADEAFVRARKQKPDYWPAYSRWVEYLISTGKRAEALKVVVTGLQHSPDAKVLREQFRVLGGKPTDLRKPVAKQPTGTDPLTGADPVAPGDTPEPDARPEPDPKPDDK